MGESLVDEQSSESQNKDVLSLKIADRPGQIDNSDIVLSENGCEVDELELRRMLEEGRDYVLVSEPVWEKLLDWYITFFYFLFPSGYSVNFLFPFGVRFFLSVSVGRVSLIFRVIFVLY